MTNSSSPSSPSNSSNPSSSSSPSSPSSRRIAYPEFQADLDAWSESSNQKITWVRPRCACIEYFRENLTQGAKGEWFKLWNEFRERDHEAIAEKKLTWLTKASAAVAQPTIARCAATMRGVIATIDAALEVTRCDRQPGSQALPDTAAQRLRDATTAYAEAWGLSATGPLLLSGMRDLSQERSRALQAMFDAKVPCVELSGPAWLAVFRLLDYLLGGSTSSLAKPVFARILLAGEKHGTIGDLEVVKEEGVPSSWYIDPVSLGLTVLEPEFIDSLRLAWRVCQAAEPQTPALRLSPAILDATSIDGPSAGAMFACAMVAAVRGESLDLDATASVALRLKAGRSLDDGRPIRLTDIELKDVGKLTEKFHAAHRGRPASGAIPAADRIRKVVLTADQAKKATAADLNRMPDSTIAVPPATTLDDVYRHLTGDLHIERVLLEYSEQVERKWEETWTGVNNLGKEFDLLYYVPPHYGLLKAEVTPRIGRSDSPGQDAQDHVVAAYDVFRGDNEEDVLARLLQAGGDRICMSEGPGSGKTIFTRRLVAFLSSRQGREALLGGKPGLAIRREESSLDKDWPDDFEAELRNAVGKFCKPNGCAASDVVDYALQHGRVTFVLDALDQADKERIKTFQRFLAIVEDKEWRCRVILTGRPWIVEERQAKLLPFPAWRIGRIEPFDAQQQYLYLRGPLAADANAKDAWLRRNVDVAKVRNLFAGLPPVADPKTALRRLIPSYDSVSDLFSNPQNLQMLRAIIADGATAIPTNRTELCLEISHRRLNRDFRAIYQKEPSNEEYLRLERMLAAAAFQMMADHPERHRVDGVHAIERLRDAAGRRTDLGTDWDQLEKVTALTTRTLLIAANKKTLSWPDRRMMEFYCGLHLANNTEKSWSTIPNDAGPETMHLDIRCNDMAVRRHAANDLWREAWIHAMLIPPGRRKDAVLLASLAELFEPVVTESSPRDGSLRLPSSASGHERESRDGSLRLPSPPTGAGSSSYGSAGAGSSSYSSTGAGSSSYEEARLRPTELMYRAWCLLEPLLPHERAYPSSKLLPGGERVLAAFRRQFQRQLDMRGDIGDVARELRDGFVIVPALEEASLALTEGRAISIDAFKLGRTAITRAQYLLFDPAWIKVHAKELAGYKDQSLRCPAQWVNWFDAWCAARYFGGRLATEAEWEHACSAGSRKQYCRTATGEDLDTEDELARVADFGRPYSEGPREVDVGGDLAGGGRRRLEPNAFGLIGMHGGVWEWCSSWHVDAAVFATVVNPAGPERGSSRVRRGGGSWFDDAAGCRAAYRYGSAPSYRRYDLGFRLALSFV